MANAAYHAGPTRQDTQRVTIQIKDPLSQQLKNLGVWDKKSGGEIDSDQYKYKAGGMVPQISLGGTRTIGDLTISRLYRQERDHDWAQDLINWAGKAVVTVTQHFLDVDGNEGEKQIVWVGVLKTVTFPDHDSESTDPAMIEIVVSPDADPKASG